MGLLFFIQDCVALPQPILCDCRSSGAPPRPAVLSRSRPFTIQNISDIMEANHHHSPGKAVLLCLTAPMFSPWIKAPPAADASCLTGSRILSAWPSGNLDSTTQSPAGWSMIPWRSIPANTVSSPRCWPRAGWTPPRWRLSGSPTSGRPPSFGTGRQAGRCTTPSSGSAAA